MSDGTGSMWTLDAQATLAVLDLGVCVCVCEHVFVHVCVCTCTHTKTDTQTHIQRETHARSLFLSLKQIYTHLG